jgi:hypothetical protein
MLLRLPPARTGLLGQQASKERVCPAVGVAQRTSLPNAEATRPRLVCINHLGAPGRVLSALVSPSTTEAVSARGPLTVTRTGLWRCLRPSPRTYAALESGPPSRG